MDNALARQFGALRDLLFAQEDQPSFAILDGAAVEGLLDKLFVMEPPHECLYRGELSPDLAEVAPYLIQLEQKSTFTEWLLAEGSTKNWGIFALGGELSALKKHFRRFLIVHNPDGIPLYFRYYDPVVFRVYLPTCNAEELRTIFGSIKSFLAQGEVPGTFIRYRLNHGALQLEEIKTGVS